MVRNKSFTLIELLVVIAIIGVLTSIVLVSTQGLQGKARITKTLEFGQSVNHTLGAYAVGWWTFDEGSGTQAQDNSGYGNNGTLTNFVSPNGYVDDTPHKAIGRGTGKYALSFDGVNDYVDAGNAASLLVTGEVTLEAWVKISSPSEDEARIAGNEDGGGYAKANGYGFSVWKSNNNLYFYLGDGTGNFQPAININYNAYYGSWHHIVGTAKNQETLKIYLDGVLVSTKNFPYNISPGSNNFIIGRRAGFSGYFTTGLIDEVRIYNRALSLTEIQKHYAEGLERHQELAVK